MLPGANRGWLPVEIAFDRRPQIVSEALVRWLEFGETPLADPFFDHTVDRLREASPPANEAVTDLDAVLRMGERLGRVRPAGFIFHISRCGSTLLANALRTSPDVLVASEFGPVTGLLVAGSGKSGAWLEARWTRMRTTLLESLIAILASYRTGEPERLVIKFTSFNILHMRLVRSVWPEVPCVVVVRDPAEVMVAYEKNQGWFEWKEALNVDAILGWEDLHRRAREMTDEEYAARVLATYFQSALDTLDDKVEVVDYEDLQPKRIREIAARFGVNLPAALSARDEVFRVYTKDRYRREPFQDDRALKKQRVTPAVREASQRWAMPLYCELRSRL
jgi:hypothetical protein